MNIKYKHQLLLNNILINIQQQLMEQLLIMILININFNQFHINYMNQQWQQFNLKQFKRQQYTILMINMLNYINQYLKQHMQGKQFRQYRIQHSNMLSYMQQFNLLHKQYINQQNLNNNQMHMRQQQIKDYMQLIHLDIWYKQILYLRRILVYKKLSRLKNYRQQHLMDKVNSLIQK